MSRVARTALPAVALLAACAGGAGGPAPTPAPAPAPVAAAPVAGGTAVTTPAAPAPPPVPARPEPRPVAPPDVAFRAGWMPLATTGVDEFRRAHPTWDGRGVLIAILDSGLDPGVAGLESTSTGDRKVLDLRDFSREGRIALARVRPVGDSLPVGGRWLRGASRVAALDAAGPWYAGTLDELPLGDPAAADLDGDGRADGRLPLVVAHASDGWVLLADTDGDGSLAGERPVHDFLVARETLAWSLGGRPPRLNLAVNLADSAGTPVLDLFFDTSGHGTHVAGIAAGHDIYGVRGFDGVAPGAQLLGLKIADDAQGGISTDGSMLAAMDYAIRFAEARRLPLVMNMSFGVGNEREGTARIDRLVDSVLAAHPDVVFTISAGNDGPGLSTLGFPGSATRAIGVSAVFPGVFAQEGPGTPDVIADFSSRGGEFAMSLATPGVAYSTVPRWDTGGEREGGTSMASPHAAGLAALLRSALAQAKVAADAWTIRQALMVTAQPLPGATPLDQGTGVPDVRRAWAWLAPGRTVPHVSVRALGGTGVTAAFRPAGLRAPGDTLQAFVLRRSATGPLPLRLRSDATWLVAPATVTWAGDSAVVTFRYRRSALAKPGVYTATVSAWPADSTLGPVARLVNTIVVPHPAAPVTLADVTVPAAGVVRIPFRTERGRPVNVAVHAGGDVGVTAFLHEPGGMPYRDGHSQPAMGEQAAEFLLTADEVPDGTWELVLQGSAIAEAHARVRLDPAPVRAAVAVRDGAADAILSGQPGASGMAVLALVGATRTLRVEARPGERPRVPLEIPAWARGVQVDVAMDPAQWSRFTDFGVTLFDSAGRQLEKSALNYAFGRLDYQRGPVRAVTHAELVLFPGLADATERAPWRADLTVRFLADSMVRAAPAQGEGEWRTDEGGHATLRFERPAAPWPMPEGARGFALLFLPREEGIPWITEVVLP